MLRRRFLELSASALAIGGASACATTRAVSPLGPMDAAAFHAERRFVDTPFSRVAYVERGEGDAAVFFHGYPLNGFQWRGALERLSPIRRCIAPDFMGMGYTETPAEQDVSPQAQVDMMVAFLDALSIDAIDVVANDSGGTIALLFAVQHPGRVRSLLLTNCDVHENNPPDSFRPVIGLARSGVLAQVFILPGLQNFDSVRAGGLGSAYTDPSNLTDECIDVYLRPLAASDTRIAQFHAYTVALEPNVLTVIEPDLRLCAAPARMVWGNGAEGFGIEWAHWLDRTLPRSRGVREIEGAKLFFPEEMPDLIAEEAALLWRAS